jgi:hypothetical protein
MNSRLPSDKLSQLAQMFTGFNHGQTQRGGASTKVSQPWTDTDEELAGESMEKRESARMDFNTSLRTGLAQNRIVAIELDDHVRHFL